MGEILAVPLGFALIVLLLLKKVSIGTAMFTASVVMGFTAGFGIEGTSGILIRSLFNTTTAELLAITAFVCVLGYLLYYYRVLDKIVDALEDLFKSVPVIIMLIPALMGVLFIPGGAILSAPVVDKLGDRMEIDRVKKSAINMVFRHVGFFIFPFSAAMILAARLGRINVYDLIKVNIPMVIIMAAAGYLLYVRNFPAEKPADSNGQEQAGFAAKTGRAVLYTSPIWIGIVLNVFLHVPFYAALVAGIITTYFLAEGEKRDFLKKSYEGIKFNMLYAVAGIMVLQGFISKMSALNETINLMTEWGMAIEIIITAASVFVGFATASNPAVVGMLFPVFLPLAPDYHTGIMYAFLIFVSGYLGYFVSPLHLCQVFTAEYFDIEIKELYREYRMLMPVLFASMMVVYFIFK